MKKIKVLYLIDTLNVGGAEKSLVDIAIHNSVVESIFITIYKGDSLVNLLKQNTIEVHQLNNSFRYEFNTVVTQLLPLLDVIKPDIIHSTLFRSDIIARKVKQYRNIPLISSFVNNTYLKERYKTLSFVGKLKLYVCQLMDRWSAKNVDLFISNSVTIMETNSKALGIKKEKVKVIYRGRSSNKFTAISDSDVQVLRTKLTIKNDIKILLNVSRLLDRKGQMDLVNSFAEVVKEHPKTILLFAGEGAYRTTLETEIEKLGLKEKVLLLGNVDYIPVLLNMADVFVFSSHYEGLPGALLEAMFAQKIIICSDIGENKECVSENEALFFKTHDIEELTSKINLVLNNLKEYEPMAMEAKKVAITKFELATVVAQYNETYLNLLAI
jgi:glycosyltransferase involved in cell wall biosynthesis